MTVITSAREAELFAELDGIVNRLGIRVRVNAWGAGIEQPLALDVEHDEEGGLVGIGLYSALGEALYYTEVGPGLKETIERSEIIAHNGRGDFECLRQWGINVNDSQLHWDTELIAHIIDSSRHGYGLKTLAKEELGIEYPSYDDIVGKHKQKTKTRPKCPQTEPGCCGRRTLDKWPVEIVARYNALDCYCAYKLYEQQSASQIEKALCSTAQTYFTSLERPIAFILQQMEARGVRVDLDYLRGLKQELEAQREPLERAIKNELGNINLNSTKQLLGALNEKGLSPIFKGKPSTDKRALEQFKETSFVKWLLQYGELETLLSSFVRPYLERNQEVVHPFFNQCGTRTGRLSCSNPNLLQIPKRTDNGKRVRRMFIPREGMLMGDCDFGQIEPRVMAHLSKDKVLCQMFNDGVDFHEFTAERLSIDRDRAKVLNLSVSYRASKFSVQRQLGGTLDEAQAQIDKWWSLFPQLRRWQETLIYTSKKSGFCSTLLGLRIKVDRLDAGNPWKREAAERQLINNITQGSAAEIMKSAMIKIGQDHAIFTPGFGLLVQVYDELLFESPDAEADIEGVQEAMQYSIKLDVPLTVDCKTGDNWASCH